MHSSNQHPTSLLKEKMQPTACGVRHLQGSNRGGDAAQPTISHQHGWQPPWSENVTLRQQVTR